MVRDGIGAKIASYGFGMEYFGSVFCFETKKFEHEKKSFIASNDAIMMHKCFMIKESGSKSSKGRRKNTQS